MLRGKIYDKLLCFGEAYKESVSTAEIVQICGEGVEQLEIYFGKYLPQLCYSLLAPLTLFVVLSFINLKAGAVLFICVFLIPVSIVFVQKTAKKLLSKYWNSYTGLGDSFLENLQGLTTLKIYQADEKKTEEMDEEASQFRKITMKVLTMQLNSTTVMDVVAYGGAAAGMLVAISAFSRGELSLYGVVLVILLAAEFFLPLRLLGSYFHIAMNGMAASDKIFKILDLPVEAPKGQELSSHQIDISLEQVNYSYEPERSILKEASLTIKQGNLISLIGASGCGKSTIAGLLIGRNKSYQGSIQISGIERSEISEKSILKNITLVNDHSYLFKGTVEENLKMGKPDASQSEMIKALEMVNLKTSIELQQGLDTWIWEKGTNFSGGQRQRLALARALLHDTPVYIFDEATSNIDVESEAVIMQVIHQLARTKTVLLISHRLANVVSSDCIYVMKDGQVIESGTHHSLMLGGGEYSQLYNRQMELEHYGKEKAQ